MSDVITEYWCYYLLYVVMGGTLAAWVAVYRLLQPKYVGLLLFCSVFCGIAFAAHISTEAALREFTSLVGLTATQEAIRARLVSHASFVGFIVPTLALVLAGENLSDFAKAHRSSRA